MNNGFGVLFHISLSGSPVSGNIHDSLRVLCSVLVCTELESHLDQN